MDLEGFRQFLRKNRHPEERITQHISIAERFEEFLEDKTIQTQALPGREEALGFIETLAATKEDSYDNVAALARIGLFTNNQQVYLAALELVDGAEVMDNLSSKLEQAAGKRNHEEIFQNIQMPRISTPVKDRPAIMRTVIRRMENLLDEATCDAILADSLRTLKDEWYQGEREKFDACESLDQYLDQKSEAFLAELEQLKDEGRLYYDQVITDEVIEFVRSQPEIARGVREGNLLYEVKIPYRAKEYLVERDERMKRYYACHCPWVRESIRSGEDTVSPRFCLCSAGYHKKPWEVIFGQHLQAEVVESVLKGDLRCRIAIRLPDNIN